jgi:hypothetical protein
VSQNPARDLPDAHEGLCYTANRKAGLLLQLSLLLVLPLLSLLLASPARALNQRTYPLQELVRDSEFIGLGRAVAVDIPKMRAALLVEESLKGEVAYKWMALNVAPGGWGHPPAMIRRLGAGVPIVFFAARVKGRHVVLGYTNGTWFQITAPDGPDPDHLPWTFTHIEVFLRRTFTGTTAEMEALLRDVIAGKRDAPPPNPGAGAGMGPEAPGDFKPQKPLPPLPDYIQKAMAEPKSGGVTRQVKVRPLTPDEQKWVDERAKQFQRPPEETAMLLAQANYEIRDAQRALEYERDHGRGGNRAWVRSAEEILDLKQRSERLCWLDIRGVMMRAGELFTPVTDPVDLIHSLRTKFTWDELDPMFDDDKWGRKKLNEEIEKKLAARSPHPLAPGDKAKAVLLDLGFGTQGSGELPMEACGWKPLPGANWDFARRQYDWDGGQSGTQRPGMIKFGAPGSRTNPIANQPPAPGLPLAAKAGSYSGASLWFAAGTGDYQGHGRGGQGAAAYCDQGWIQVRQGETRSFLVIAQVYTPDHTDEVGEPRSGWFYINRPSRYIDAGIRVVDAETRTVSLLPQQALMLKVEPVVGRFDRVLLRVEVRTQQQEGKRNTEGRNEVRVIAYADGIGEVARATADLNGARKADKAALDASDAGVAFAPAFGLRTPGEGYVPEFYLANVAVRQINDGPVDVVRGDLPVPSQAQRAAPVPFVPAPAEAPLKPAAAPAARRPVPAPTLPRPPVAAAVPALAASPPKALKPSPPAAAPPRMTAGKGVASGTAAPPPAAEVKGARSVVLAVDTSSSMGAFIEKARAAVLEALAGLKPGDRFALLDCAAEVRPFAPEWTPATPEHLKKAGEWVRALKVTSGTNTAALLERALSYKGVSQVVMVTDGGPPSRGIMDVNQLLQLVREKNTSAARIDALLVTQAPADNPASRLAQETRGQTRFR